ncbi:hypothetical protein B0H34DRAFT_265077 [Crassisporium funariophilum]|nr:hypothetical protein B0H34DRAFT_265077 [Crassisporium funariophilum]
MEALAAESLDPRTVQLITFVTLGAFAVQIWELLTSFFDEVEYLWRSRLTFVKSLYFWSRYFALAVQIVNLALTHALGDHNRWNRLCVGSSVFKAIVAQQALTCVEIILVVRVYALYNQSRRVKYLLCTVFLTAFTLEMTANVLVVRSLAAGKSCKPKASPMAAVTFFGVGAGLMQSMTLAMTLFKYVAGRRYGWTRTPLSSLMLRDGLAAGFLVFALLAVIFAYEGFQRLEMVIGNAAFSWYITLVSATGCRLILNMRKLADSHPSRRTQHEQQDYAGELTTDIDLDDSMSLASFS